jgi:hypothetical protein
VQRELLRKEKNCSNRGNEVSEELGQEKSVEEMQQKFLQLWKFWEWREEL